MNIVKAVEKLSSTLHYKCSLVNQIFRQSTSFSTCPGLATKFNSKQSYESVTNSAICLYGYQQKRNYNKRKTVKMPPTKPFRIGFPGEIDANVEELDLSETRPGFEDVEELGKCNETVKKIFSLYLADGRERKSKRMANILNKIKEHPADVASLEVQIAEMTVHIRHQVKHMLEFRKDKKSKIILFKRIRNRRKKIEELRSVDFEKFEWLLSQLQINYVPQPEDLRGIGRRELRRRAAEEKYESIKAAKMKEFHKKLVEERNIFEKIKEKEMEEIKKELKELGIEEEMTSVDQTMEALGLGEPFFKKKEPTISRRSQILARKFELYKHRREDSLK